MKITIKHHDTHSLNTRKRLFSTRSFLTCLYSIVSLIHSPVVFCSQSTSSQVYQDVSDDINKHQDEPKDQHQSYNEDYSYLRRNFDNAIEIAYKINTNKIRRSKET